MKHTHVLTIGIAAATVLWFTGCKPQAQDHAGHDHGNMEQKAADKSAPDIAIIEKPTADQIAAAKPYPLDTCPISGEKLGGMGEPPLILVGNQQVKLCCPNCLPDVKKDPAKVLAKLRK